MSLPGFGGCDVMAGGPVSGEVAAELEEDAQSSSDSDSDEVGISSFHRLTVGS